MIIVISSIILVISIIYFFLMIRNNNISLSEVGKSLFGISNEHSQDVSHNNISKFRVFLTSFTILLFIIMFISSFIPTLFTMHHLTGIFLIIHAIVAPVFSIALAILILFYSFKLRLTNGDFKNYLEYRNNKKRNYDSLLKILFWFIAFLSIPLLLSIILILFPILGTDLQNFNIIVHRVSATLISIASLILLYFYLISKKQLSV